MKGKLPLPSNVTRISQAIKPVASDGISQVVYYQVLYFLPHYTYLAH